MVNVNENVNRTVTQKMTTLNFTIGHFRIPLSLFFKVSGGSHLFVQKEVMLQMQVKLIFI